MSFAKGSGIRPMGQGSESPPYLVFGSWRGGDARGGWGACDSGGTMKSSRSSSSPLVALAGLALAGFAYKKLRRDLQFFEGKIVLISGGSRGLGLEIARQLRAEGATLALLARDPDELARAKADLLGRAGKGEVATLPCDLSRKEEITRTVGAVAERFGGLDVLINNAGIIQVGPLANLTPQDFEETMQIHFWGNFYLMWASLPFLRGRKGARIVNVASIGGKIAIPHLAPYSASKFALVGLSNALGVELAREGVRVTTVAPGLLRTGSHVQAKFKGQHAKEFNWFATSDNVPGFSVSVEYAARQIVEACRSGRPALTFPPQMRAAEIAQAVFPNLTAHVLGLVNRFVLPKASSRADGMEAWSGEQSRSKEVTPGWKTGLVDRAAAENNEKG